MKLSNKLFFFLFSALCLTATGSAQTLEVEVGGTRAVSDVDQRVDHASRLFNKNLGILTRAGRAQRAKAGNYDSRIPLSFPTTVWLKANGQRVPVNRSGPQPRIVGFNLIFDANGPNAFDPTYKDFLIAVYNQAQPFLDNLFGVPAVSGNLKVKNYDASLGDREVVSGGIYVPNAVGGPEIRFPFYGNDKPEVTAINFVHTLLLAYLGPNQYGFDAFNEGFVRAVTMKVMRTPAARLPALDADLVERVLTNTYDVEGLYDWYNQRALGGSKFIAPNLRDVPLPDAGSIGGLYLLRYRMAGSAWLKALVEIPGDQFIRKFNEAYYTNPTIGSNIPALVALGQTTLNTLRAGDPTLEGMSFANWFSRQFILETNDTRGTKLLVEPVPITSGLSGSDFGVFLIQANLFETTSGGNETLLSGTSFPFIWQGNFPVIRLFDNTQSERMDIAGGYGSVAPNISDQFGGVPYRGVIEVPVSDQIERVYVPVGGIATASDPSPNDFFGTVVGANLQVNDTLSLQVTVNGTPIADVPVSHNAFGVTIGTGAYLGNARIAVNVVRTRPGNGTTVLLTRKVNKGPGSLALDLRVESELTYQFPNPLPKGIAFVGFPVDPFLSLNSQVLNLADNQVLAARYNPSKAKYDLYPDLEPFKIGHGYFIRSETATNPFTVTGRVYRNVPGSVALKPGWNMVACPLMETVPTNRVQIIRTTDFPVDYSEAQGVDIGTDFFQFSPNAPDTASGAPETGTMIPATTFEPGKAYFVRVLNPDGVVLNFGNTASGSAPIAGKSRAAAPTTTGWQMSLNLSYGKNQSSAIIGQSASATRSFDPKEDSGMPPSFGSGFQVILEDYEALYRDIRPLGSEKYTVHLQGLTKGKATKLTFTMVKGSVDRFLLRDGTGKSLGWARPGFAYNFVPKSNNEWIQIEIGGGK